VQDDEHFLTVARYVHANPRRAALVQRACDWLWSDARRPDNQGLRVAPWPVDRPRNWVRLIDEPLPESHALAIQASLHRGRPFGTQTWVATTAQRLDLKSTIRPRGRPPLPVESLSPRYRRKRERERDHKST